MKLLLAAWVAFLVYLVGLIVLVCVSGTAELAWGIPLTVVGAVGFVGLSAHQAGRGRLRSWR